MAHFLISTEVLYLQCCLTVTWLVLHEIAAILVHSVYTVQSCTMSRHFMQSHIRRVSDQKTRHYTDIGSRPWFIPEPGMKRGWKNLIPSKSHQCSSYQNHESKERVITYLPQVISGVHTRTMNQKRVYEPTFLKSSVQFIPEL